MTERIPPRRRLRSALILVLLGGLLALAGCGIVIDDRAWDIGPGHDGSTDGALDAGAEDDAQAWHYDHDPEDCPELAENPPAPGDRPPSDPSCDGVSHFYCSENPHDPCCGGGGGGGGGGGDGRNPGSSGGSGSGSGSGSGGGRPPDPRF